MLVTRNQCNILIFVQVFLHWELINWKTKEFMQHLIFFKIVYFQPTTELTTESTGPPYLVKSPLESTNSSQRRH